MTIPKELPSKVKVMKSQLASFVLALSAFAPTLATATGAPGALTLFPPKIAWKHTTLDWFRFGPDGGSPSTFQQRILYYDQFWKKPSGPMLVFWGGEGACEDFYNNSGALFQIAPKLNALIVFLEHRYRELLWEASDHLSGGCKAALLGGSYGGMASAWHRLKYPHLTHGAVASSSPVDIYPGENKSGAFWEAVLSTYSTYGSEECGRWIRDGVSRINSTADRALLSSVFRTCDPVLTELDVQRVALYVQGAIATEAMVDYPYASSFVTPMPANPVSVACMAVGSPENTDRGLFEGLNTVQNVFLNWTAQLTCHNTSAELLASNGLLRGASLGDISRPWNYMACSSLILEPLTSDGDGFFVESPAQIPEVEHSCHQIFPGIEPRINWMRNAYGNGVELARNLRNVVFTDGDKDPWRAGGMPSNSSDISPDGSVSHVLIQGAAHHQDLRFEDPADSAQLLAARKLEFDLLSKWLK